jgi:hypothetical protein
VGVLDLRKPVVYLEIRELPDGCRPCMVERWEGATLLVCDPRERRRDITEWSLANLWTPEVNVLREAFGIGPINESAPDWVADDGPTLLYVPAAVRLPGAKALQGGAELARRRRRDQLQMEMEIYTAEIGQRARRYA